MSWDQGKNFVIGVLVLTAGLLAWEASRPLDKEEILSCIHGCRKNGGVVEISKLTCTCDDGASKSRNLARIQYLKDKAENELKASREKQAEASRVPETEPAD